MSTPPAIHASAQAVRRVDPSISEWESYDIARAVIAALAPILTAAADWIEGEGLDDWSGECGQPGSLPDTLWAIVADRPSPRPRPAPPPR